MGYKVDFDALDSFEMRLSSQINGWNTDLQNVTKAVERIQNTRHMSGEGADNIKSYFENVHGMIQGLLAQLMSAHQQNCFLYKRDYFTNIDKDVHVVIKENELRDIKNDVKNKNNRAINIDAALSETMSNIKDIYYIWYRDIGPVDNAHNDILRFVTDLDEDIKNLENRHYKNDFTSTRQLITALTNFIAECKNQGRSYKSNFDVNDLAGSESFRKLYNAYVAVSKEQESKQSLLETEIENQKERVEILEEERAEREKKAKVFKWIVTGVCIIASIAITAATAGAGAPLIVTALTAGGISAGSAAVSTGLHGMADEYIEYGYDRSKYDWAGIGKDTLNSAAIGFATGFAGGCAGGAVTNGLTSAIGKNMLQSSNSLIRIGSAAVIGSVSEVSSGVVSRATEATIVVAFGGGDAKEEFSKVFDGKKIGFDAVTGGAGGAAENIISNKKAQKAADDLAKNYNTKHDPVLDAEKYGIENIKRTPNNGADFSETDQILKFKDGEIAEIKIKSTGDRVKDYELAEKMLKEKGYDVDFESMRKGKKASHVWHHLDDYNAATNETTMQFITRKAHNATNNHMGSAAQYHIVNGSGYKKSNFKPDYSADEVDYVKDAVKGIKEGYEKIEGQQTPAQDYIYVSSEATSEAVKKSIETIFGRIDFEKTDFDFRSIDITKGE